MNSIQLWLATLKAGDTVIVQRGYGRVVSSVATVDRTTDQQIIVGGVRYRRKDGYIVGRAQSYASNRITEATSELLDSVHCATLAARLSAAKWDDLPLATLDAVASLLWPPKAVEALADAVSNALSLESSRNPQKETGQ